jgi:hypothetical protein
MASLYEIDRLPSTSALALTEFSDRYLAAQGVVLPPNWVDEFGDMQPTNSPKVTYPISQVGGEYKETNGDSRFKNMQETSFDVKVVEFDLGYEARLLDLQQSVFAYRKWKEASQRFTVAEQNHRARSIRTLLEAGTSTTGWDGVAFFHASHPANYFDSSCGTFSNYQVSTKDCNSIPNIIAECTAMMEVKDENGEKLGVVPDTILLPTAKFMLVSALISQAQVSVSSGTGSPGGGTGSMSNPIAGLRAVHVPELTDADDWYLLDSKLAKVLPPWVGLRYSPGLALELRQFDESSDFFKNTGKIKVSSHIWYGFGMPFPHAIRLVKGA